MNYLRGPSRSLGSKARTLTSGSSSSSASSASYSTLNGSAKLFGKVRLLPSGKWRLTPIRTMSDFPEHIKVTLPALSPTMEVGTIVSWEKKEGDALSEGDLLCEIETDKATMGFETPEEGYLAKIILNAGSKDIPIGKLLCVIVENEADVSKFANFVDEGGDAEPAAAAPPPKPKEAAASPPPPKSTPMPVSTPIAASGGNNRPFASPMAKRIAAEKGIDLFQMTSGSGMDGMIVSKDVENFTPMAGGGVPMGSLTQGSYSESDLSSMRKTIAKRLQSSKLEIPHYYLTVELQMDNVLKLRKEINQNYEKEGIKLSVNDFVIKATALACKKIPACNSAWMGDKIREYHNVDVSVAVDTGSGLITPIVTEAETKGLGEISENIKDLAGKAKEGKLAPHEFMGGTITVSNLGMFGISHFTAIINPPQACILAVGGTTPKLVPGGPDGGFKTINTMKVTMSCDHRVVDGAVGAQWLQHFKKYIEQPQSMLL